jgi:DNA repair exonuclease SbcCD nuclease subunit
MSAIIIMSDLHYHRWSQFATVNGDGENSRLRGLLAETHRAADILHQNGGGALICAGDWFHVKDSVSPEVLNPVLDTFRLIVDSGIKVIGIPGNHDLASKESCRLSNAAEALTTVGVKMLNELTAFGNLGDAKNEHFLFVPWYSSVDMLRTILQRIDETKRSAFNLVIHAPLNGVIAGLPDHGLSAEELKLLGFRRVFVGHHHNHKAFEGEVYSIGALAHHHWGDVGSQAGFILLKDGKVTHIESVLPKFINLDRVDFKTHADLQKALNDSYGNYVSLSIDTDKKAEIELIRETFLDAGAAGVLITPIKKTTVTARGATISASVSLEASISDFINLRKYPDITALESLCVDILHDADKGAIA